MDIHFRLPSPDWHKRRIGVSAWQAQRLALPNVARSAGGCILPSADICVSSVHRSQPALVVYADIDDGIRICPCAGTGSKKGKQGRTKKGNPCQCGFTCHLLYCLEPYEMERFGNQPGLSQRVFPSDLCRGSGRPSHPLPTFIEHTALLPHRYRLDCCFCASHDRICTGLLSVCRRHQ